MCGISSIFRNEHTYSQRLTNLQKELIWVGSIRGYDSTGLLYGRGAEQAEHYKRAVSGWDFIELPVVRRALHNHEKEKFIITHNRAATRGDVMSANSHPFHIGEVVGVHNGTVANHRSLSDTGFHHPVDSAHIYSGIDAYGSSAIISRINGSFNLLWYDHTNQTIHQVRNPERPYFFAKLKEHEVLVGASEKPMLKWLVARNNLEIEYVWAPEPYVEYIWEVTKDMVRPADTLKHEAFVPPKPPPETTKERSSKNTGSRFTNTSITGAARGPQKIEFFFTAYQLQASLIPDGTVLYNYYGETVDGGQVIAFSCMKDDYELDTWYIAEAYETVDMTSRKSYYRIVPNTIIDHPIDDPKSTFHTCCHCRDEYTEDNIVFIQANPFCVQCCHQLDVDIKEVDAGHAHKLATH